jgi:hypothetical protein
VPKLAQQLAGSLDRKPGLAPEPPGPDSVTSRAPSRNNPTTWATSRSRPTNELVGRGRFVFEIVFSGGNPLVPELVDPDRPVEVLQPVLAEIRQVPVDERDRRLGEQHLAPVARCGDASPQVHVLADVALVRDGGGSRVDAHAHAHGPAGQRCLSVGSSDGGMRRGREREEERTALRVDLDAAVCRAGVSDQAPVLGESVRVALCAELS